MAAQATLQEYLEEIRDHVCARCVERLPGAPPCEPLGKKCAIEAELPRFVNAVREVASPNIEPYVENIERRVCSQCERRGGEACPCPLHYLLVLTVEAIETVDRRHETGVSVAH
jgi:hypothetical protein